MEISSVTEIWKYLKWLPKFLLKRIFTKNRLSGLIIVDVRPRHDYVTVNLGEIATFDMWLQVINMSPFEVELDRAQIEFLCAGTSLEVACIKKTRFKAGEIAEIYVKGDIPEGKANRIAKGHENSDSSISMNIDFNCNLHNFSKESHVLHGVRPRFINANIRRSGV